MARLKNIELFEHYMAFIFDELYDMFPVCINIDTENMFYKFSQLEHIKALLESKQRDEVELKFILSSTLFWLKDNGLLTFKSESNQSQKNTKKSFSCVVLTAKGLSLLNKKLDVIEKKPSVIDNISKALSEGVYEKIKASVSLAIDQLTNQQG